MLRGNCVEGRWYEKVKAALPDGKIVFSRGADDWSGSVVVVARLDDGRWLQYGWSYGSCSACDVWEGQPEEVVAAEIQKNAGIMSAGEFSIFLANIQAAAGAEWLSETGGQCYPEHVGMSVDELLASVKKECLS